MGIVYNMTLIRARGCTFNILPTVYICGVEAEISATLSAPLLEILQFNGKITRNLTLDIAQII
jgi:hypothetical protein